jgi:hypothetical protein
MGWFNRKPQTESLPAGAEEVRVLRSDARVDDPVALARLLEALPESDGLGSQLQARFFARAWDKKSSRDYWVYSDGTYASCYTICGLNLKQAAAVRVRWDAIEGQVELSERLLASLVSAETGDTVQVLSYVRSEQTEQLVPPSLVRSA